MSNSGESTDDQQTSKLDEEMGFIQRFYNNMKALIFQTLCHLLDEEDNSLFIHGLINVINFLQILSFVFHERVNAPV
jgi:hypothetical protein